MKTLICASKPQSISLVSPKLHRKIAVGPRLQHTSLNAFVTEAVQEKIQQMSI
jgi:predicted HicB family RNase H-like nuclease